MNNGTVFVFSAGARPFDPEPIPTSAYAFGEVTGHHAGYLEVSRCCTRGQSQGMYITFASIKVIKLHPLCL